MGVWRLLFLLGLLFASASCANSACFVALSARVLSSSYADSRSTAVPYLSFSGLSLIVLLRKLSSAGPRRE